MQTDDRVLFIKQASNGRVVSIVHRARRETVGRIVRQVITEVDPVGLLFSGAPIDEYAGVIEALTKRYLASGGVGEQELIELLESHFFPGCCARQEARELLALLRMELN